MTGLKGLKVKAHQWCWLHGLRDRGWKCHVHCCCFRFGEYRSDWRISDGHYRHYDDLGLQKQDQMGVFW